MFHDEGRPVDRNMLSAAMRAATKTAGLDAVTWHDLRHHHASMLLSAGVSPALFAERLGHDLQTLPRTYAHVICTEPVRAIVDDSLGGSADDWLRTTPRSAAVGADE
ncbi:MAG TPA: tyrosine-type recombinase/integrase [Acidimicrobiales bacterium]|nr:tyrosine-type recombinase/integrase [Acidimicrobiales bacterium]